ncbi:MAG: hypothetical protein IJ833_03165 [Lachnospiraceae bacterium]|nr:hypothetical protein [Lachnospiraceae bacterium]
MKKRVFCTAAALCMVVSLAACGSDSSKEQNEATEEVVIDTEEALDNDTLEDDAEAEEETEETEDASVDEAEETEEEANTEEDADDTESAENTAEAGYDLADYPADFVNFDDMCFYVNGKKYTLGQVTLQDMIDDGVPFDENDIANAGNNLNKNYQSEGFKIDLADYWAAQVYTFNDTDDNQVTSECYVNEIYLPINRDKTQNVLSFDFPLGLTLEDLEAKAGEPDDTYHYDGDNGYYSDRYTYTHESEKYMHGSSYTFEFQNGVLSYVTIEYIP